MAYTITDACISCGSCASDCPAGAISEGDAHSKLMPMHVWTVEHVLLHVLLVLSKINVLSACQFYSWYKTANIMF